MITPTTLANLTGPMPETFAISSFPAPALTSTTPTLRTVTLGDLVKFLTTHERRRDKNGRGWSGARYKTGTTRANANVVEWSVAAGDFDHLTMDDYMELRARLVDLGLAVILYSTYSSTPDDFRFRLAIPLVKPVPKERYTDVWHRMNAALFLGKNDPQTKDASRMLFTPAAPADAVVVAEHIPGAALDWEKLPEAPVSARRSTVGPVTTGQTSRASRDVLQFTVDGAPIGQQRGTALRAARSFLSAGKTVDETAELVWRGLQVSPMGDEANPWTEELARAIVEDIAGREAPPLEEWPDFDTSDLPPAGRNGHANGTAAGPPPRQEQNDGRDAASGAERPTKEQHAPPSTLQELLDGLNRPGAVPEIDASVTDLRIITAEAWGAIKRANDAQPFIFKHASLPVWISRNDDGRAMLVELTPTHIRHVLARVAEFFVVKGRKVTFPDGGEIHKKIRSVVLPPAHVCADVLATPEPVLPVVARVTECPVFGPDGTLQTAPGYHAASRTFLAIPAGLMIPAIPAVPTVEDIARARTLIEDELLGDFPFPSRAEKANAIGLGLEPFARPMIDGPMPLHSFESPTPGSGKGLLVDALLRPSCGRSVGIISQAQDDDEWRKRITAALMHGYPAISIDNCNKSVESGALASALTRMVWDDRLLGQTRMVSAPIRCSWVLTANNPTYSTEMARRTVRSRIDPKCDRPQDRDGWRHPELLGWVDDNRGQLIWAFCTLVRAWIVAGRPKFSGRALGSFERWSHVVGGILENAGIPGFLGNQASFYDTADTETAMWRAFVVTWWEKFEDKEVGSSDLFPLALEAEGFDLGDGQAGSKSQRTRFGKMLSAQRDRVIGDYRVTAPRTVQRAQRWRLVSTQDVNVVNVSERFDPSSHAYARANDLDPDAETFTDVHNVHIDEAEVPSWAV